MEKYYTISPEVPGSLGENTIFDKSTVPWGVEKIHVSFDGWIGSDLLNVSPCFFVTSRLMDRIISERLTGVLKFVPVEVSLSDIFNQLHPNKILPDFFMLKINGEPFKNDFGKTKKNKLIISQKVYNLLNGFELSIAEIDEAM